MYLWKVTINSTAGVAPKEYQPSTLFSDADASKQESAKHVLKELKVLPP